MNIAGDAFQEKLSGVPRLLDKTAGGGGNNYGNYVFEIQHRKLDCMLSFFTQLMLSEGSFLLQLSCK